MHHPSIFKKMKKGGKVEEYQDGGLLKGKDHEQGGVPAVVDGGKQVELEGEEFITSARSTALLGVANLQAANDNPEDYAIVSKDVLAKGGLIDVLKYRGGGLVDKKDALMKYYKVGGMVTKEVPKKEKMKKESLLLPMGNYMMKKDTTFTMQKPKYLPEKKIKVKKKKRGY